MEPYSQEFLRSLNESQLQDKVARIIYNMRTANEKLTKARSLFNKRLIIETRDFSNKLKREYKAVQDALQFVCGDL
jgi:hypothetical protein